MCVVTLSIRGGHYVCPTYHTAIMTPELEGDEAIIYNTEDVCITCILIVRVGRLNKL